MMKARPFAHLGDAGIALVLFVALSVGYDVKWIVAAMLIIMLISEIFKSIAAFADMAMSRLKPQP